jgi:hypothetical protein
VTEPCRAPLVTPAPFGTGVVAVETVVPVESRTEIVTDATPPLAPETEKEPLIVTCPPGLLEYAPVGEYVRFEIVGATFGGGEEPPPLPQAIKEMTKSQETVNRKAPIDMASASTHGEVMITPPPPTATYLSFPHTMPRMVVEVGTVRVQVIPSGDVSMSYPPDTKLLPVQLIAY